VAKETASARSIRSARCADHRKIYGINDEIAAAADVATSSRRHVVTSSRRHAVTPPRRHAATPPRRHAVMPSLSRHLVLWR
jgi:hypothetical protein